MAHEGLPPRSAQEPEHRSRIIGVGIDFTPVWAFA
jgi:hypothetical protein